MIRRRKKITGKKRWKMTTEEAVEKGEVELSGNEYRNRLKITAPLGYLKNIHGEIAAVVRCINASLKLEDSRCPNQSYRPP